MASKKSTATVAVENIVVEVAEAVVASEVMDNTEDVVEVVPVEPLVPQEVTRHRFTFWKQL